MMQDAERQLSFFIKSKIEQLKELNRQRLENWKSSLLEYTNLKGNGVKDVLSLPRFQNE